MRPALPAVIAGCILVTGFSAAVRGVEEPVKLFDYNNGIMEYYAGYCNSLGDKEIEESYLLRYPEFYMANRKKAAKRQTDLALVRSQLEEGIARVNRGNHEYTIFLRGQLGEYDDARQEFKCRVLDGMSCLQVAPERKGDAPAGNRDHTIIARGLLFNKISMIRLFFDDAASYGVLKCPAAKAQRLLKDRPVGDDGIEGGIFVRLRIRVLQGKEEECRRKLEGIRKMVAEQGMVNSYLMLAEIRSIEAFEDAGCRDKLGEIEKSRVAFPLQ